MDEKDNHTPSDAEQFFSRLPCPIFITVFSSFIFVYLLGLIFGQGVQVYPIYNEIMPNDDCPECRVFNSTKASITERQFRIIFKVDSTLDITRSNAWRLLRIRIFGPIFSQEMRAVTDNCGIYGYGVQQTAMHFELIQEGPTTVELYCLDKLMLTVSDDVTRYERSTQSTLFHTSIKEVSNICRVEELNDEYFHFFSKSNVFNYTNNYKYTYIPRLKHQRKSFDDYVKENHAMTINNVFRLDYTNDDINQMSYHELFEKVILVIFVQSHFGQTIIFSYNKQINKDSSPYFDLFQKVTDGKFKSNDYNNYKNVFCYQKLTTIPNYHKIDTLTESEYEILRKSATPRDESRGEKVYLANNFILSDELNKESNIFYFGEEKIAPPTQSPTPPPTQSLPPPTPTEIPPEPTPKPTKTTNTTISTDSDTQKTKNSEKTVLSESINEETIHKEKSSKSKIHISKSSNSTSIESKQKHLKKSNSTSSDSKLSKLQKSKSVSRSNTTKKLKPRLLNSTSTSNSTSSNINHSKKKRISKLSNSSSISKKRSNSSNTTTNDSNLLNNSTNSTNLSHDFDDDIGSPILLSYPDESEAKQFSLEEKIEMLSTAKALISIDDNNDVLYAFWMPRESPLILILPPVRTSLSKAAQRINASGRIIHYVYGEKEGVEYPDEYNNLANKCMNDIETANSKECDDVFKEMKFKFDTKKVLDIVNNL